MKKSVIVLITILLCFTLISCSNNNKEIISDVTEKIAETIATVLTTEKKTVIEAKPIHFEEDELYNPFSEEDAEKALEIIRKYKPEIVEAGPDCLFDFNIRIDGVEYAYHYDCGSFENVSSGIISEFSLSENDKEAFNRILFKYVPHSNPCQIVEDFTAEKYVPATQNTEPATLLTYNTNNENLSFTLTKTAVTAADFSIKMLSEAMKQESNALISPVSLITALSMTANGAKGETLKEMENVLGGEIERLNNTYSKSIIDGDGVKSANSIWIKDTPSLKIRQSFIDTNKKYYGAEIYKEKFNGTTANKINRWISDNTDGMIKKVLDELPSDAVMYLINTILFDAEWKDKFNSAQVRENQDFTSENGDIQKVTMLTDSMDANDYNYFRLGKTQGVIRDYTNGYSFAALLPDEGVTVSEALNSFTGNQLAYTLTQRLLASKEKDGVFLLLTKYPKFEFECSFKFADSLKKIGMPLAFDPLRADFSGINEIKDNPLFISEVYHNTKISFTENGTKAGAATYVEMKAGSARQPENIKTLYFDRPFIYIIFKTDNGLPLFMGTVRDFSK